MLYKRVAVGVGVLMAATLSAEASSPYSPSSTTIRIQGVVPVICRVQLSNSTGVIMDDGRADFGMAQEFCNAPRGYRVVVRHPANLEGAAMIKDGVRIPLSQTGETILTDSSRPDIRRVRLVVDAGSEPERFTHIGVNIEARG